MDIDASVKNLNREENENMKQCRRKKDGEGIIMQFYIVIFERGDYNGRNFRNIGILSY